MLSVYVNARETLLRLRNDQAGVVSFEYVIVAACIIAAVAAAYGTDATTGIGQALSNAITAISAKVANALK